MNPPDNSTFIASYLKMMIGGAALNEDNREMWLQRLVTVLKARCGGMGTQRPKDQPLVRFFSPTNDEERLECSQSVMDGWARLVSECAMHAAMSLRDFIIL